MVARVHHQRRGVRGVEPVLTATQAVDLGPTRDALQVERGLQRAEKAITRLVQRGAALPTIGFGWRARHRPALERAWYPAGLVTPPLEAHPSYHRKTCAVLKRRPVSRGRGAARPCRRSGAMNDEVVGPARVLVCLQRDV